MLINRTNLNLITPHPVADCYSVGRARERERERERERKKERGRERSN